MNLITDAYNTAKATFTNYERTPKELAREMLPGSRFVTNSNLIHHAESLDDVANAYLDANRSNIYNLMVSADMGSFANKIGDRVKIGDLVKQGKITDQEILAIIKQTIIDNNNYALFENRASDKPLSHGAQIVLPSLTGVRSISDSVELRYLNNAFPKEFKAYFDDLDEKIRNQTDPGGRIVSELFKISEKLKAFNERSNRPGN
jgi:hypothetical protein